MPAALIMRPAPLIDEFVLGPNGVTRREFLVGVAAAALLTACGAGGSSESSGSGTRTIRHFAGTTEVPVDARRIVTLQDQNALLPLLELGVRPVASAGLLAEDGSRVFRRTDSFDTTGIEFIGEYGEPNLEAIAGVRPDLIISDEFSADGFYEQLSQIAPTVFVQVFDRPLTEALLDFARVVGREDDAAEFERTYRARIDRFKADLGDDLARTSVSLLSTGDPGTFYQADSGGQAQFTVMRDLGLLRPAPQRPGANEDFSEFTFEAIPEHDADAVIVNDFSGDSQGDPGVTSLVESPLYVNLAASKAGQSYVIDATRSVGSAWARMNVFIDELERILLAPGFNHDVIVESA
jgi:iron complex transport system substrate-binding protein